MKRLVKNVSGLFPFHFLEGAKPDDVNIAEITFSDLMPIPAAFDTMPEYLDKRGLGLYRINVEIPENTDAILVFGAVSMWSRIYLDGKLLMEHIGGYTRFEATLPPTSFRDREIIVMADNQFDYRRSPLQEEYMDFYSYGGIIRPIELILVPPVHIRHVIVSTIDWKTRKCRIELAINQHDNAEYQVSIEISDNVLFRDSCKFKNGRCSFITEFPGLALWTPANPAMHEVRVVLDDGDAYPLSFGIRQIEIRDSRLLLNGEALKLFGVCRHESHPQFGSALPESQILADLQLIRKLGFNFIRGCHYPMDQRFLALCDRMGIMVWEENLGWNQRHRQLTDEYFINAQLQTIDEMLGASINHPSVIMWGILNEGGTQEPENRPCYERLVERLHQLDPGRPVTFAETYGEKSLFHDLADIISFNFYPGWYHDSLAETRAAMRRMIDFVRNRDPGKPFIFSEIGAGAIPGCHSWSEEKWSEEYQARLLREVCLEALANENLAGLAIWLFCDTRSNGNISRPGGFNRKGILDEYRRPKLACREILTMKAQGKLLNI